MFYTERLKLRNFKPDDIKTLFEYRNDPKCGTFQTWDDTTQAYLEMLIETNSNRDLTNCEGHYAITINETDELIGDFYISKKGQTISLGFTISPLFQRKGFMYELLDAFIPHLLQNHSDCEICCLVHPENRASQHLMKKLNFSKEEFIEKWNSDVFVRTKSS